MPKTAETDQGLEGQAGASVRLYTSTQAATVGQSPPKVFLGEMLLKPAKRKLRATSLPAANAASVLQQRL